jgi:hypothetical protein
VWSGECRVQVLLTGLTAWMLKKTRKYVIGVRSMHQLRGLPTSNGVEGYLFKRGLHRTTHPFTHSAISRGTEPNGRNEENGSKLERRGNCDKRPFLVC